MPDTPINLDTLVSALQLGNQNTSRLIQTIAAIFPRAFGSFTMAAAATKTVSDANVLSTSVITLMPTNAAAGTLMGSTKSLYVSALTAGSGFTVATASGVAAAGTETFSYSITNPV